MGSSLKLTECTSAIDNILMDHAEKIEAWFANELKDNASTVYASFDLRYSGFKLAVIDTNVFPGGFNNLSTKAYNEAATQFRDFFQQRFPAQQRLLIIPESHTRNQYYLANLAILREILEASGLQVRIGSLLTELKKAEVVRVHGHKAFTIEPLSFANGRAQLADFDPEIILLNNDLANGIPTQLNNLTQPIVPTPFMGWWQRKKTSHFYHYNKLAYQLSAELNCDAWFLTPLYSQCDDIDFKNRTGEEELQEQTHALLMQIKEKYKHYAISLPPYVVIKADAGTYGMAVMIVKDAAEIKAFNRKQRQQMAITKGQRPVNQVILQEGIYTIETKGSPLSVAEPVIYAVNSEIVGGFYRIHAERGVTDNLNSPGMHFLPMLDFELNKIKTRDMDSQRYYAYTVAARLGLLALAREEQNLS